MPDIGGGHTYSDEVFRGLQEHSAKGVHEFFLLDSSTDDESVQGTPGFPVIRVDPVEDRNGVLHKLTRRLRGKNGRGKSAEESRYLAALSTELRRHRIDCALSLVPWKWLPIIPNILPIWDLEHRRKPYFPELSADGEWEKREAKYVEMLPRALAVITGTDLSRRQIERFYGVDPEIAKVIPFPTPSFALEAAAERDGRLAELPEGVDGEFLFYPAQFWPHKNHVRLLQAVKILRSEHGWKGSLVFIGSDKGNIEYVRNSAVSLGIQDSIKILGFVERPQLVALYRRALALTFMSYLGPDNFPPLEAFALGCPVITSDIPGARECLGDSPLYVHPDSAEDIVTAVLRVKNEPGLRERMIASGHRRSLQWTVKDYVNRLIDLLDQLELRFQCFRGLAKMLVLGMALMLTSTFEPISVSDSQ